MAIFDDWTLEWEEKQYTIPANRILGAIGTAEEFITLPELAAAAETGKIKFSKVACAYGAVLRYAGARVTDEDVYGGMFRVGDNKKQSVIVALQGLLGLMMPKDFHPGNGWTPPAEPAAGKKSSRKHTRPL